MSPPETPSIKVGFRFKRKHAKILEAKARELANNGHSGEEVELFDKASRDAAIGEPLIVHCRDQAEVHLLAAVFRTVVNVTPTLDGVSSTPGGYPLRP